jgi:meso-butanediol dehydrogenase / (S,S)-butanediol dehydrogenase / diacetyl reductase
MKLAGKVAIITGAGAGIGEATAILFAQEGAKVVLSDIVPCRGVETINASGGAAVYVKCDVAKEDDVKHLIDETIARFGRLDLLHNNAGIVVAGSIANSSIDDFDRTMAVNVRGTWLCSLFAIPHLKKTKGVIINCSSSVAIKGVANRAAYSASKGAVLSLTKAMAMDHIADGIRVNAILPGTTDTPSLAVRLAQTGNAEEARKQITARQPMGRLGRAEEIAEGILLLATNEFCTGTCLSIDGGMTV